MRTCHFLTKICIFRRKSTFFTYCPLAPKKWITCYLSELVDDNVLLDEGGEGGKPNLKIRGRKVEKSLRILSQAYISSTKQTHYFAKISFSQAIGQEDSLKVTKPFPKKLFEC